MLFLHSENFHIGAISCVRKMRTETIGGLEYSAREDYGTKCWDIAAKIVEENGETTK